MDKELLHIAINIKEYRLNLRMSQEKLAEAAELSISHLYKVEAGKKGIGMTGLIRIARALGTSLETLVQNKDNTYSERKVEHIAVKLFSDCTELETIVMYETLSALKDTLKRNTVCSQHGD